MIVYDERSFDHYGSISKINFVVAVLIESDVLKLHCQFSAHT